MNMRTKIIGILLLFSMIAFAQENVKDLTEKQIPSKIPLKKNKVVSCVSWNDNIGDHYIIETETALLLTKSATEASKKIQIVNTEGKFVNGKVVNGKPQRGEYVGGKADTIRSIESDYRLKGLFTYHYIIDKNDSVLTLWKNIDQVTDCSYKNLKAEYLSKPIITDLDNNGIKEVWLVYQLGCRIEPTDGLMLKIVMYQGRDNYVIRGNRLPKVVKPGEAIIEANMKPDASFEKLPKSIQDYGLALWEKYKKEN